MNAFLILTYIVHYYDTIAETEDARAVIGLMTSFVVRQAAD